MTCRKERIIKNGGEEQEEPEVYFADTQTSESEADFGCMPDSSASEHTDDKACAFAPVACTSPQTTLQPLHDTWKWRGPCCLVRGVHRQVSRCLYTPTWEESIWQGLTVQPQRITHVTPTGHSSRAPFIETRLSHLCTHLGTSQCHESYGDCGYWSLM